MAAQDGDAEAVDAVGMVSGCHAGDVDRLLARPPHEGDDVNPLTRSRPH